MPTSDSNNSHRSVRLAGSSSAGGAKPGWLTQVGNLMRPNFGRDTPGRSGRSRVTKLIMGTLIFVLVGQLFLTGLTILDSVYKLGLQQPIFKGANWLTWYIAIYVVVLLGLWFLLNYLGFFPRPEPAPPAGSRLSSSSSGGKKAAQIPGIGGPRVRQRVAAPPPAPANSRKGAPIAAAKATKSPSEQGNAVATRANDDAYERVKATQRQKRRREMR
ncbi:MAG TPA: hypothetical protein VF808_02425 [Ktedonobacterales bacterium]